MVGTAKRAGTNRNAIYRRWSNRANRQLSSPNGRILRDMRSNVGRDPQLQTQLRDLSADAGSADWLEYSEGVLPGYQNK